MPPASVLTWRFMPWIYLEDAALPRRSEQLLLHILANIPMTKTLNITGFEKVMTRDLIGQFQRSDPLLSCLDTIVWADYVAGELETWEIKRGEFIRAKT